MVYFSDTVYDITFELNPRTLELRKVSQHGVEGCNHHRHHHRCHRCHCHRCHHYHYHHHH